MSKSVPSCSLLQRIRAAAEAARKLGTLKSIETKGEFIDTQPPFLIRVVQNLARKEEAANTQHEKKPPRDPTASAEEQPAFNPFLPYESSMHVEDIEPRHVLLLNKFNVVEDHVLLVTAEFEEQSSLLTGDDFTALWKVMDQLEDGFAFYNSGKLAGASQRHKHLQIFADRADESLDMKHGVVPFDTYITQRVKGSDPMQIEGLHFLHAAVGMGDLGRHKAEESMRRYLHLLNLLNFDNTFAFSYNLLICKRWMLMVPRREECFQQISINSLGFCGCLLVRNEMQLQVVQHNAMKVLQHVSFPLH